MIRDIGLDDHDLPSFTRCASRAEGRLRATEHLMSCPQSVSRLWWVHDFLFQGTYAMCMNEETKEFPTYFSRVCGYVCLCLCLCLFISRNMYIYIYIIYTEYYICIQYRLAYCILFIISYGTCFSVADHPRCLRFWSSRHSLAMGGKRRFQATFSIILLGDFVRIIFDWASLR